MATPGVDIRQVRSRGFYARRGGGGNVEKREPETWNRSKRRRDGATEGKSKVETSKGQERRNVETAAMGVYRGIIGGRQAAEPRLCVRFDSLIRRSTAARCAARRGTAEIRRISAPWTCFLGWPFRRRSWRACQPPGSRGISPRRLLIRRSRHLSRLWRLS